MATKNKQTDTFAEANELIKRAIEEKDKTIQIITSGSPELFHKSIALIGLPRKVSIVQFESRGFSDTEFKKGFALFVFLAKIAAFAVNCCKVVDFDFLSPIYLGEDAYDVIIQLFCSQKNDGGLGDSFVPWVKRNFWMRKPDGDSEKIKKVVFAFLPEYPKDELLADLSVFSSLVERGYIRETKLIIVAPRRARRFSGRSFDQGYKCLYPDSANSPEKREFADMFGWDALQAVVEGRFFDASKIIEKRRKQFDKGIPSPSAAILRALSYCDPESDKTEVDKRLRKIYGQDADKIIREYRSYPYLRKGENDFVTFFNSFLAAYYQEMETYEPDCLGAFRASIKDELSGREEFQYTLYRFASKMQDDHSEAVDFCIRSLVVSTSIIKNATRADSLREWLEKNSGDRIDGAIIADISGQGHEGTDSLNSALHFVAECECQPFSKACVCYFLSNPLYKRGQITRPFLASFSEAIQSCAAAGANGGHFLTVFKCQFLTILAVVEDPGVLAGFSKMREIWSRDIDDEAKSVVRWPGYLRLLRCSGGLFPEQYHRCLNRLIFGEGQAKNFPYELLLLRINCMAMAICCLDFSKARAERKAIGGGSMKDPNLNLTVLSNSFVLDFLSAQHPSIAMVKKAEASFASALSEAEAAYPSANLAEEKEHFLVNASIAKIAFSKDAEALEALQDVAKKGDPYFSFFAAQGIGLYQCLYEQRVDVEALRSRKTVFFENRTSLFEAKARLMDEYSRSEGKSLAGLAEHLSAGLRGLGEGTDSGQDYPYCELPCLFTVCERWYE